MPFFCFIVYNGHTLCLINVIGPINVFGKLFFVNIFLFLHFGYPCKINFFYWSIFLQKKTLFGVKRFRRDLFYFWLESADSKPITFLLVRWFLMSVWWGWSWFEKHCSDLLWTWLPSASESRIDPPTPPFGLIISQSMKHTSCFNPGVKKNTARDSSILSWYLTDG